MLKPPEQVRARSPSAVSAQRSDVRPLRRRARLGARAPPYSRCPAVKLCAEATLAVRVPASERHER
jgi:hypothetical protein